MTPKDFATDYAKKLLAWMEETNAEIAKTNFTYYPKGQEFMDLEVVLSLTVRQKRDRDDD